MSDPTDNEQTTPERSPVNTGGPSSDPVSTPEERVSDTTGKGDTPDSTPDHGHHDHNSDEEPDTFPRAYVEKLRRENADARSKVKDRDDLAARLHTALAAADGRLADPTDLPFSDEHLDPEAMGKAIADLIARKPHLKAIRVKGDAGQGPRGHNAPQVDLLGTLRNLAG